MRNAVRSLFVLAVGLIAWRLLQPPSPDELFERLLSQVWSDFQLRLNRDAELNGVIAVLLFGPHGDHVTAVHLQYGDRNVRSVLREDTGHTDFLGYQPASHLTNSLQLDLDVDTGR